MGITDVKWAPGEERRLEIIRSVIPLAFLSAVVLAIGTAALAFPVVGGRTSLGLAILVFVATVQASVVVFLFWRVAFDFYSNIRQTLGLGHYSSRPPAYSQSRSRDAPPAKTLQALPDLIKGTGVLVFGIGVVLAVHSPIPPWIIGTLIVVGLAILLFMYVVDEVISEVIDDFAPIIDLVVSFLDFVSSVGGGSRKSHTKAARQDGGQSQKRSDNNQQLQKRSNDHQEIQRRSDNNQQPQKQSKNNQHVQKHSNNGQQVHLQSDDGKEIYMQSKNGPNEMELNILVNWPRGRPKKHPKLDSKREVEDSLKREQEILERRKREWRKSDRGGREQEILDGLLPEQQEPDRRQRKPDMGERKQRDPDMGERNQQRRKQEPELPAKYSPRTPAIDFDDVGGMDGLKKRLITEGVGPIVAGMNGIRLDSYLPDRWAQYNFDKWGVTADHGFLLYGPPGTGKTYITRALAGEIGFNYVELSATELIEKYVGESSSNVKRLFKLAQANQPCIIFIDEIDALAPDRGSKMHKEQKMAVSQLLRSINDIHERDDHIIVIAATNRRQDLDDALIRNGRFDNEIEVPPPNAESCIEIIKQHLDGPVQPGINWTEVGADAAEQDLTAADLEKVAELASEEAMIREAERSGKTRIRGEDLTGAIAQVAWENQQ